jgi:AcrR family transcriptional regulator
MPRRSSESVQRAFPWRETFLAALRQEPQVKLACKTAGISRNTVYTHLRKDARFRRQWEHAVGQGQAAVYRLRRKQLAADPEYQRLARRALERLRTYFGSEGRPFLMLRNLIG